jgi:hypothetical protein
MTCRHNTSSVLPGPLYYINSISSSCWVVIHSHICRREFTVPSLFPLLASNTDLMTSLSIFGNISSIWKINKNPTCHTTCNNCSPGWAVLKKCVLYSSQSSHNWPPQPEKEGGGGETDRQKGSSWWLARGRGGGDQGPYQDSNPSHPSHSLVTFQIMKDIVSPALNMLKRKFHTIQYWNIVKMFLYNQ